MTEPTTPQLSEDAVREIEARRRRASASWHSGDSCDQLLETDIPALIRDWKAMRAENDTLKDELNVADDALETQSQWMSESRAALAQLQSENAALRQWKAEALPLLTRYDNLADTFGGELGSSKVTNLERGVAALREQLAEAEIPDAVPVEESVCDCHTWPTIAEMHDYCVALETIVRGTRPEHRCKPIARAIMDEGRDWWIGELLEPIPEWPKETHCLHMKTPLKDVSFLCNAGDFEQLMVLGNVIVRLKSLSWLESTEGAVARSG